MNFDHWADCGKAGGAGGIPQIRSDFVVVEVSRLAALVAHQKDAVVQAVRMFVGDIGIGALDPADQVRTDEQVEDAVDAVRGDAPVLALGNGFRNVIGRSRPLARRERLEHALPHRRPLLTGTFQRRLGGNDEFDAAVMRMGMSGHDLMVGVHAPPDKARSGGGPSVQVVTQRQDPDAQ